MPKHEILLIRTLAPIHSERVHACIRDDKLGSIQQVDLLEGVSAYAVHSLVYALYVDAILEYPVDLELGVILKKILSEVSWVASVLFEEVCSTHDATLLYRTEASDEKCGNVTENLDESVGVPTEFRTE